VGQWKDGKKHGQGTYILPGGGRQVGQWNNNKFIENPKSYKVLKYTPKKMTEERPRKAESSKSLKISKKSSNKHYHMVKAGETLYGISYRYGLTVKKIQLLNKLFDRSVIYPGQKLLVTF
jgi:LysM repeat protein